jgi:hypothetical protein
VVDYGKLAEKAKALQRAQKPDSSLPQAPPGDPAELYERVKALVLEELTKANVELGKRRMPLIERVLSPSYVGRLCLSFGVSLLLNVDYTPHPEGGCRIIAIISGPPNGAVISRKEFIALNESPELERLEKLGTIPWSMGSSPQRIAVEIVSGLLGGEFD